VASQAATTAPAAARRKAWPRRLRRFHVIVTDRLLADLRVVLDLLSQRDQFQ
jgi:hypothetical protein